GRAGSAGGLEGSTADELHGVGELRYRQQTVQRALRGVIDVVEVGDTRARHVQHLLDVVALVAQRLREVVEVVDRIDDRRVVFVQETADVGQRHVECSQGGVEVARAVRKHLGHRGDV